MIFDRTQNDVDTAVLLRREKVQNFNALSEDEIEILERGMMTINTLNRIEEKQEELSELIEEIGYFNADVNTKVWNVEKIFNKDDFERILQNTKKLRDAFFVYSATPNTPPVSFHFNDINALEKILNDLDIMINDVKSHYKRCGTFRCGVN